MNKESILQDIAYYSVIIEEEERLLKHHKVMLEQAYKQIERITANETMLDEVIKSIKKAKRATEQEA